MEFATSGISFPEMCATEGLRLRSKAEGVWGSVSGTAGLEVCWGGTLHSGWTIEWGHFPRWTHCRIKFYLSFHPHKTRGKFY